MPSKFGMKVFLDLVVGKTRKAEVAIEKSVSNAIEKGGKSRSGRGKKKDKEDEKQTKGILGILGKVATIASILLAIKPFTDALKAFVGFVTYGILKILKWYQAFNNIFKEIQEAVGKLIIEKLKDLIDWFRDHWPFGKDKEERIPTPKRDAQDKLLQQPGGFTGLLIDNILGKNNPAFGAPTRENAQELEEQTGLLDRVANFLGIGNDTQSSIFKESKEQTGGIGSMVLNTLQTVSAIAGLSVITGGLPSKIATSLGGIISSFIKKANKRDDDDDDKKRTQSIDTFRSGGKTYGIVSVRTVRDAIITKGGQVIETDPQDNIIATKQNPLGNGGGLGGGGSPIHININAPTYGMTPDDLIRKLERALASRALGSGSRY